MKTPPRNQQGRVRETNCISQRARPSPCMSSTIHLTGLVSEGRGWRQSIAAHTFADFPHLCVLWADRAVKTLAEPVFFEGQREAGSHKADFWQRGSNIWPNDSGWVSVTNRPPQSQGKGIFFLLSLEPFRPVRVVASQIIQRGNSQDLKPIYFFPFTLSVRKLFAFFFFSSLLSLHFF